MANKEEKCKGRFWEGRYKSQALLDETALLSCMAYVDLNPVRAGMEDDLTTSDFTSIQVRLFDYVKHKPVKKRQEKQLVSRVKHQKKLKAELGFKHLPEQKLMPFDGSSFTDVRSALPFTREGYFDLVDKTGRLIKAGKRGFIKNDIPPIITRLGINPNKWIEHVQKFGSRYCFCAGAVEKMRDYAHLFKRKWAKGVCETESLRGKSVFSCV